MRTGKKAPPVERRYKSNAGQPTTLSDEVYSCIERMVLDGKINKEIIATLEIPDSTFYTWLSQNTRSLNDKIGEWRRHYLLDIAEQRLAQLANSKNERIQLQAIIHLSETLGKKWYSKREQYEMLHDDEGAELEPENKAKLDALLKGALVITNNNGGQNSIGMISQRETPLPLQPAIVATPQASTGEVRTADQIVAPTNNTVSTAINEGMNNTTKVASVAPLLPPS